MMPNHHSLDHSQSAVSAEDLLVRYGDRVAVNHVSFDVEPGTIFAVIGPNGAGKTSLIECLEGLRPRASGTVLVAGHDPCTRSSELENVIGVQLQEASYPSRSRVGELCRLFSSFYPNPTPYTDLLHRFGLGQLANSDVHKLSGGEAQKLSLVLAMLGRPSILFLDELTTGLDPNARRSTWDLIQGLREDGTTIILTSHYMDEVESLADRVAVLIEGEIRAYGTVEDVIGQSSEGHEYVIDPSAESELTVRIVESAPGIHRVEKSRKRIIARGSYPDGYDSLRAILNEHGLDTATIRHRPPSLEDAFLRFTREPTTKDAHG